jgi:hypothetical protein
MCPLLFATRVEPRPPTEALLIIGVIFSSLGAVLLLGTALWLTRELRRRRLWTKTTGEIIEHVEGDDCTLYVVTYRDSAGGEHRFMCAPPDHLVGLPVGAKVALRYNPHRPARSDFEPPTTWWNPLPILGFLCVGFLFIGMVMLVLSSRLR